MTYAKPGARVKNKMDIALEFTAFAIYTQRADSTMVEPATFIRALRISPVLINPV